MGRVCQACCHVRLPGSPERPTRLLLPWDAGLRPLGLSPRTSGADPSPRTMQKCKCINTDSVFIGNPTDTNRTRPESDLGDSGMKPVRPHGREGGRGQTLISTDEPSMIIPSLHRPQGPSAGHRGLSGREKRWFCFLRTGRVGRQHPRRCLSHGEDILDLCFGRAQRIC